VFCTQDDFCSLPVCFRLVADPSEAVGSLPGFDAAHNFERMQIDYGDVPVRRASHVDARPVGLHKNSGSAISHSFTLHLFSGNSVTG
jgi:hypothetical protein